jgi:diguanylate cyclase (GGDEF)-like protein
MSADATSVGLSSADLAAISKKDSLLSELGPLAAPGRLGRLAPFAIVIAFTTLSIAINPAIHQAAAATIAGLGYLSMAGLALLPWRRLPRGFQAAFIMLPIFLNAGLMLTDSGLDSHLLGLILLPLVWLALYETTRRLYLGILLTACLLVADALFVHPTVDDCLRAFVLLGLATVILPAIRRIVVSLRSALGALDQIANLDPLTGLANRRGLDRRVRDSEAEHSDGLGLIFIDLDRFKAINDTLGHDAGDQLLLQVGGRLSQITRSQDVVARLGGDEFVIASNCSEAAIAALTNRIRDALGQTPYQLGDRNVSITASVGFSHVNHRPDDTAALLNQADVAMYLGKAANL